MKILVLLCCVGLTVLPVWSQTTPEEEIVIELTGDALSTAKTTSMWDLDAWQWTRKLRGKTREQVLYQMPLVSDRDGLIRGEKNEYMLVEYYGPNTFRKFLFHAQAPQTFITAAATPADVLAVNKKYAVNIGLLQKDFENFYAGDATQEEISTLPAGAVLYRLPYKDINTPKKQTHWFLFENGKLSKTFFTKKQKDTFLQQLPQPSETETEPDEEAQPITKAKPPTPPRKALLYGGTAWDQAYMPRVINPHPALLPPPAKTENK